MTATGRRRAPARRAEVVKVDRLGSAEEMLAALSPAEPRWKPDLTHWMFRGVGSEKHRLVPSILRGKAWFKFLPVGTRLEVEASRLDAQRVTAEFFAIYEFMRAADQAGLAVPEDSVAFRGGSARVALADPLSELGPHMPLGSWPGPAMLSVVGLAQHYMVPTRLLDWTWKPRVAAYFAAERVVMREDKPPGALLVVWALQHRFVTHLARSAVGQTDMRVIIDMQVVTAPQATNPNLGAQAGAFTVVRNRHEDVSLDHVIRDSIDAGLANGILDKLPAMRKLTLPHSEAPRLLRLLGLDGVSAASVYPGYGGVALSLQERRRWRA